MVVNSTMIASGTVNTAETSFTIAANDQIIDAEPPTGAHDPRRAIFAWILTAIHSLPSSTQNPIVSRPDPWQSAH